MLQKRKPPGENVGCEGKRTRQPACSTTVGHSVWHCQTQCASVRGVGSCHGLKKWVLANFGSFLNSTLKCS